MRRVLEQLVESLLRLTRWYNPAEIEKREQHTLDVAREVEKATDERRMTNLYQDRLVGRRTRW
jgi:hypothetical protein